MSARNALVVGASGMVGEPLVRALLEDGWSVHGVARFRNPEKREALVAAGAATTVFDITQDDPAELPDADVVFLEVWESATWGSREAEYVWGINFHGVGRVVERYAGVADIVNGCTINVYGNSPEPSREDTPCRPDNEYGRSRFAQERLIDYFSGRGGKRAVHLRYAHANSARRGAIRGLAESILAEKSLGGKPDAWTQVIAIEDFVRVTKAAADRVASPPVAVNCCHPRAWTRRELAEAIRSRLGKGKVVFDCESGGREDSAYADVSRMVEWFGEPTIAVDELIARVAADLLG